MRKQVNTGTYFMIKQHFLDNPDRDFAPTAIRDELTLDYYSVKVVLEMLVEEKAINIENGRFKLRREQNGNSQGGLADKQGP
jgi:hypothetical protein